MNTVEFQNVGAQYGDKAVLSGIELEIPANSIYALIGPSGCGKTTLLRSVNRLNDLIRGFILTGSIMVDGKSVYSLKDKESVRILRRGIGMIFQKPNPLPTSIMKNMTIPYLEHVRSSAKEARELALERLKLVGLYNEIKDRLDAPAIRLSGGQQQRLCIARSLMLPSNLLLMDEPCSALDPISTYKIEEILFELKKERTIIMVTHNIEQARRVSDYTAFFYNGVLVESGATHNMFAHPQHDYTQKYVSGRMIESVLQEVHIS
ncbi:MAG: phosphate ABC transporter ATP-binding protein [Syntrophomonadaceae bacterium]|jgi:phosphate transport system ATP-binding protein|nr:phosphate ABC transporter ATP-binding protein [Syntrophomonadaceae bacterium]